MKKTIFVLSLVVLSLNFSLNAQTAESGKKENCKVAGLILSGIFDLDFRSHLSAFRNWNFQPGIGVYWVNKAGNNHLISGNFYGASGGRVSLFDSLGNPLSTVRIWSLNFTPEYQYRHFILKDRNLKYQVFLGLGVRMGFSFANNLGADPISSALYRTFSRGFTLGSVFEPGIRLPLKERFFMDFSLPIILSQPTFDSIFMNNPGGLVQQNYNLLFLPYAGLKLGLGITR